MYAKIIDNALQYPAASEFAGIPHYETNDAALRRRQYLPLVGTPEEREGYSATPSAWHVVEQSATRTEPRQHTVEDYETDEETGERRKVGEHTEMVDTEITVDTSYIQIDDWQYTELPPELEPEQPDTTERDNAEKAIVQEIVTAAAHYNAVQELISIEDITIPNLRALANQKGMPNSEFDALITKLTPYKWQLEAVENTTWAVCWEGLKSRFAQWMQEILASVNQ